MTKGSRYFLPVLFASVISNAQSSDPVAATISALQLAGSHKPAKNEIVGKCEIEGKGDVHMPAPCNGVEVILYKNDVESARTRTDANGEFRFGPLSRGTYDINIESPKFKLAKPIHRLEAGQAYAVRLK